MKSYKFYIQSSHHFLSSVSSKLDEQEKEYYYLTSILLSWISLESYINFACDSLSKGTRIDDNKRNFLKEIEIKPDDEGVLREISIRPSTTKKILFILQNFSKIDIKKFKQGKKWNDLKSFEELRDRIVHHKEKNDFNLTQKRVQECYALSSEFIEYLNKLLFR